jgi:hypothetical protein
MRCSELPNPPVSVLRSNSTNAGVSALCSFVNCLQLLPHHKLCLKPCLHVRSCCTVTSWTSLPAASPAYCVGACASVLHCFHTTHAEDCCCFLASICSHCALVSWTSLLAVLLAQRSTPYILVCPCCVLCQSVCDICSPCAATSCPSPLAVLLAQWSKLDHPTPHIVMCLCFVLCHFVMFAVTAPP